MPADDWATRIANATTDQRVQLHLDRWSQWNDFITNYVRPRSLPKRNIVRVADDDPEKKFKNKLQAADGPWSVWDIADGNGDPYIQFDASFGSLNSTSDLDINVIATDTRVLEQWREFVQKHKVNGEPTSFSVYWDSNFYFEPAEIVNGKLKSIKQKLLDTNFRWTTPTTAATEFDTVKKYADAYFEEQPLVLDAYTVRPNPANLTLQQEIAYYDATIFFANQFKQTKTVESYLKFASCKIEGLVSIPALAICKVFGNKVYNDFIKKEGTAAYLKQNPIGTAIAVYELVRNLEMHAHRHGKTGPLEFKSKYANRLLNILGSDKNICEKCKRDLQTLKHGNADALQKTNTATFSDLFLAMRFLQDYMDGIFEYNGKGCDFVEEVTLKGIKDAKRRLENYIKDNLNTIRLPEFMQIKLRF